MTFGKRLKRAGAAATLLALMGAGLVLSPAQAATDITVEVGAKAVGAEVNKANELLYSRSKNDGDNRYQIAYEGTVDMRSTWREYSQARTGYILSQMLKGFTRAQAIERWQRFYMIGGFEIGFTVDPQYVQVDPSFVTPEAVQSRYEEANDTLFTDYMICSKVTYDAATGKYTAYFQLGEDAAKGVQVKEMDRKEAQPSSLSILTPQNALSVKQSDFEPGKSFVMTNPRVEGSIDLDQLRADQLPLNFEGTGPDVTIKMVDTYVASYGFQSQTSGLTLPPEVLDLVPASMEDVAPGTALTPKNPDPAVVEADGGQWEFIGWDPATQTVTDQNVNFVGN